MHMGQELVKIDQSIRKLSQLIYKKKPRQIKKRANFYHLLKLKNIQKCQITDKRCAISPTIVTLTQILGQPHYSQFSEESSATGFESQESSTFSQLKLGEKRYYAFLPNEMIIFSFCLHFTAEIIYEYCSNSNDRVQIFIDVISIIFLKNQPIYLHFVVGSRAPPPKKQTYFLYYFCCSYHSVSAVVISRLHKVRRKSGGKPDVVRQGKRLKRLAKIIKNEDNCPHVNSLNNDIIPTQKFRQKRISSVLLINLH